MSRSLTINRQLVLAARPKDEPDADTLRLESSAVPTPSPGQMLLRTDYLSLYPYMRGRMSDAPSYAAPVPLGAVMEGGTDDTRRFKGDEDPSMALAETIKLEDLDVHRFDAVFYSGGHGPLWDLAKDPASIHLIESFVSSRRPIAAVCHAPAIFRHTKGMDGKSLVSGRNVTGFINTEEATAGLTDVVPFLVEDMLVKNCGVYSKGVDWASHVVVDGKLVTGQNPASSKDAAKALLKLLS
jgi:putative intracellular protease/amidase